jgi:predicted DNA-binding ribbon-helix-helix protein
MCRVYAGTDPGEYRQVTRSVRLHRVVTSIRLENRFWTILDRMAADEGVTTPKFLAVLYDEVAEAQGEVRNFASLLRVACTTWLARQGAAPDAPQRALRPSIHATAASPEPAAVV